MKKSAVLLLLTFCIIISSHAQQITNRNKLNSLSTEYFQAFEEGKQRAIEYARTNSIPMRIETDSVLMELINIDEHGRPQYYTTFNTNAAATSSTNEVYSGGAAGLSLSGSGVTVCEWDGGTIRTTHQEFDTRATNIDASAVHWHSTHVAGTIMASGVYSIAKGMAFAASLKSYDWDYDNAEMATEAANGNLISNHSYGWVRGWESGIWYGDPSISTSEDYLFGFYDISAKNWDEIAANAPYYLIVKSAGNDRGDSGDGSYPADGPYDCIPQKGVAKNILTVGAVEDIPTGYSQPSDVDMSSFSGWGPADDGRIKPDIVANGVNLTSAYSSTDDAYAGSSGTSMSAPATTGSLALLIQHYENVKGSGMKMLSSTLKALVLHTADESGTNDGPDYKFGWGLLNTQSAAAKITEDQTTDVISEHVLVNGESYTRNITTTGTNPIRVTIVWTDPPGTPPSAALDPADAMLVNDLDLRITESSNTFYPWKLDKDNPSNAATHTTENNVDNVEMVDIASPTTATTYTITVDHDGTLASPQAFSLIISGDIDNAVAPVADFYTNNTNPGVDQSINFTDVSSNIPTSWQWSFNPTTVKYVNSSSSTSQNPEVEFQETGIYEVVLYASNAYGNDTETKSGYITVGVAPSNYCDGNSANAYGYISRVQLGTIDNPSSYTNIGGADPNDLYYEDWTAFSTNITVGQSYSITITNTYTVDLIDLGIWIDWNRDGVFSDGSESILCEIDNYGEGTFSVNVPINAQVGSTRMRLRTFYWGDVCYPCATTENGEVEDYTLNILPASTTWIGNSADWNDAANWPEGFVPNASYEVIISAIPSGGSFPVISLGVQARCYSLTLQANATITINGTLEVVK